MDTTPMSVGNMLASIAREHRMLKMRLMLVTHKLSCANHKIEEMGGEPVPIPDYTFEADLLEVLSRPVTSIAFSPRAANPIQNAGITTILELATTTKKEFQALGFGRRAINEIKDALEDLRIPPWG